METTADQLRKEELIEMAIKQLEAKFKAASSLRMKRTSHKMSKWMTSKSPS